MRARRRHILLLALVLAVAAGLLGREIVNRMLHRLKDLDATIEQTRLALADARKEIDDLEIYRQRWNKISGFADEPVALRQQEFSAFLSRLENESGVLIRTQGPFTARPLADAARHQVLSCTLNLSCDLASLAGFLLALDQENDGWLVRIESLSIRTRGSNAFGSTRYMAELTPTPQDYLTVDMTLLIPAGLAAPTTSQPAGGTT